MESFPLGSKLGLEPKTRIDVRHRCHSGGDGDVIAILVCPASNATGTARRAASVPVLIHVMSHVIGHVPGHLMGLAPEVKGPAMKKTRKQMRYRRGPEAPVAPEIPEPDEAMLGRSCPGG